MPEVANYDTEAAAVAELAALATSPETLTPGALIAFALPPGVERDIVDLEEYLDAPRRPRGQVTLHDAGSLQQYVRAHRVAAQTAIYADIDHATITAVINGHTENFDGGPAGWGDHRAQLSLRKTPNWQHWAGKDRAWLAQTSFAEHIEEGLIDIVEPPAADMLEMAQTFQATSKVNFKSSNLLANGQRQFVYEETLEAKAGQKGTMAVPLSFTVGVLVFEGQTEGHRVTARLQTRIDGGDLKLRYLLDRPQDVLKAAFDSVVATVETGVALTAYRGTPLAL